MTVTAKIFPKFLEYALGKNVFTPEEDLDGNPNNSLIDLKIILLNLSFDDLTSLDQNGRDLYIEAFENEYDSSYKQPCLLKVFADNNHLKFSLDEITWTNEIANPAQNAIVYYVSSDPSFQKHFVMHFNFGEAVLGGNAPFKLKMTEGGEIKINFNPA